MYTETNFKTKKALKEAVKDGDVVRYFQPGFSSGTENQNGVVYIEGPHYPEPHKWYATCKAIDGAIIHVK